MISSVLSWKYLAPCLPIKRLSSALSEDKEAENMQQLIDKTQYPIDNFRKYCQK
jgi:hypothetical protein